MIAGNPAAMGQMTRHVADAGSYAPVTILIQELPDGGSRAAYDSVASAIAPYHDAAAWEVARRLDAEVLIGSDGGAAKRLRCSPRPALAGNPAAGECGAGQGQGADR